MSTTQVAVDTWLFAQVLHSIFMLLVSLLNGGFGLGASAGFLILAAVLLSLPALGLCILLLEGIRSLLLPPATKFGLWLTGIAFGLAIGIWLLCQLFFPADMFLFLLALSTPGLIAAVIASVFCYKQYHELFQITTYEDDFLSKSE